MTDLSAHSRIVPPRAPQPSQPYRFPVIATIAPVGAAVAIWLLTSSPFALVFAALGPVTAVASLVDSRLGARRTGRRELARFAGEITALRSVIDARHAAEVSGLREVSPDAARIVERSGADPYRWAATASTPIRVALGTGTVRSALEWEAVHDTAAAADVTAALATLARHAALIDDGPVLVDARLGIGVAGHDGPARALARSVVVQLAWALSPEHFRIAVSKVAAAESVWLRELPHESDPNPCTPGAFAQFVTRNGDLVALVAVAPHESALPGACRIVVRLGEGASIALHPDRSERRDFHPAIVSREQATTWAQALRGDAAREGLGSAGAVLPTVVALAPLLPTDEISAPGLACVVAVDGTGPVTIDLVAHGPHAVVGGTTGSGKSELLIAWVLAIAAAHPPESVTFLLVDFKGGSAFGALEQLPHTVGTITDLDEAQAARALASLRAELRFRERALATAGVRDSEGVPTLARLVIVVDEFAAMLADHPDLHALFSDIAARGRSLGVHLVLCTQRPAGVVRDSVLANADLRVSLRVNNRADSSAVVMTDAAAAITAEARGRAVVCLAGGEPRLVQFALADPADATAVARRWTPREPPRRPWREPLPSIVHRGGLPADAFGLLDLPHEQRRERAVWVPDRDGHLLVLGAQGSGKSVAVACIASVVAAPVIRMPDGVEGAWDVVADLNARLDAADAVGECVVVVDDVDSLLPRFGPEHRSAFAERLGRVLREGPGRGIRLLMSAQRLTAETQGFANAMPGRLWLRHSSRQDFVVAGGDGQRYLDQLPAGGGLWQGDRVQVGLVPMPPRPSEEPRLVTLDPTRHLAIVSSRAPALVARLRHRHHVVELASTTGEARDLVVSGQGRRTVIVGDVDDWQSRWGAIAAVRQSADVLFDGCTPADFRALTRSRELPPPLSGTASLAWLLTEDGGARRARLPE